MNKTKKRYLSCDSSVRKMYTLSLDRNFPEAAIAVKSGTAVEKVECDNKYHNYWKHFREHFNYGFGVPRTDVCGRCEEQTLKIKAEKNSLTGSKLIVEKALHKKKANSFYAKQPQRC